MSITGPDVSQYQPYVAWEQVATKHPFGIVRCVGEGHIDDAFASNWKRMKRAGLIRGAYLFLDGDTSVATQVQWFIQAMDANGGLRAQGDLPPILDFERGNGTPPTLAMAKDAARRLKSKYGKVILYSGNYIRERTDGTVFTDYIWVPHYGPSEFQWSDLPRGYSPAHLVLWQYASSPGNNGTELPSHTPGYGGNTDMNLLMFGKGEMNDLRKLAGMPILKPRHFVTPGGREAGYKTQRAAFRRARKVYRRRGHVKVVKKEVASG